MNNIEEAYQFAFKVQEKLNKKFDNKNSGRVMVEDMEDNLVDAKMKIQRRRMRPSGAQYFINIFHYIFSLIIVDLINLFSCCKLCII